MKRSLAVVMLIALSMIIILPSVLDAKTVLAQSTSYTIQNVDHQVEIMLSGHVVVRDTIKVSGQLTNGFLIGLPSKYGSAILKAVAYDDNQVFPMDLGVELGSQSGFYAAQVNFEGANPQTFTVVFILSNSLLGQDLGFYQLDFPAYPGFTTTAARCNVTISPPAEPATITISKSDGEVNNATTYTRDNLPAFTNMPGSATFDNPAGILQITHISSIKRQITTSPAGTVSCSDSYRLTNNGANTLSSFILSLPATATNVVSKGESGRVLTTELLGVAGNTLLANASLISFVANGQSTILTAEYNLPSDLSNYSLNFSLFPAFNYYVDQATFTFTPPEGAKITAPQLNQLDPTSTLTRDTYQDTLTINRQGVSYVDANVPSVNSIEISYDYNPVWSSFRPTFWALILSAIACVGVVFWRRRKPAEKAPEVEHEKPEAAVAPTPTSQAEIKAEKPKSSLRVTPDTVRRFIEEYDERKEISNEIKSLDARAQKGKIPRRQYKVQRKSLEVRFDSLTRNINQVKEVFRSSGSAYADLTRQLDNAEADLNEAEENIKTLEAQQNSGEISKETYKKNTIDYHRQKDKADTTISGILLRLREKIH